LKSLYESILSSTKSGKEAYYVHAIDKMLESGVADKKLIVDLEKQVAVYKVNNNNIQSLIRTYIGLAGNACSLNWIDTSEVTNMHDTFQNLKFNGDISKWDVSSVKDMNYMFASSNFNGNISKWNVRKVKDMYAMFFDSSFNRDISTWKVNDKVCHDDMFLDCPIKEEYKPKFKR